MILTPCSLIKIYKIEYTIYNVLGMVTCDLYHVKFKSNGVFETKGINRFKKELLQHVRLNENVDSFFEINDATPTRIILSWRIPK